MKLRVFPVIAVLVLMALGVFAQAQPQSPPKVMRIYREEVKPGMSAPHAKVEPGWPKAFAKANAGNYYLALQSVSGANEVLFVEPHTSYAEIEKIDAELEKNTLLSAETDKLAEEDGHYLNNSRTLLLTLNEELSRPNIDPMHSMRFVLVTTYRVRPGHMREFTEFRRMLKANQESAGAPNRYAVFTVSSGAPSGTVMVFRPLKSLAELDPRSNAQPLPEDRQRAMDDLIASSLMSAETSVYSIKPEMSYPPKEFATADPAFWGAKPKPPSKSAAKKEAKAATGQ